MEGLKGQMIKRKYKKYNYLSLEHFSNLIKDITKIPVGKEPRSFIVYSGERGKMYFDFAIMGLKVFTSSLIFRMSVVERGKYKYQFDIGKKHGLWKIYVEKSKFVLTKGTTVIARSKSSYYILKVYKNKTEII